MRRQVVPSIDKLYQEDFPKAFFRSALREEQRRAPFLERNVLNLLSSKTRQKKQCISKLFQILIKFISKAFPK